MINYIGTGIIFPVELDSKGFPILRTGRLLLESSIKMILSWPVRQRIFLDEFGSLLLTAIGEPNDELLKGLVEHYIVDSLRRWELRVDVNQVLIQRTEAEKLQVTLSYTEKTTGLNGVLTFPFYKTLPY